MDSPQPRSRVRRLRQLGRHRLERHDPRPPTALHLALMMSGFGGLFLLANQPIARVFVPDARVVALAARLLVVAGFFQVCDGLQVVALAALRGLGDVRRPALLVAMSYWVVALPLAWLPGFVLGRGAVGVWVGLASGLAMAAATLIARFRARAWEHRATSRPGPGR